MPRETIYLGIGIEPEEEMAAEYLSVLAYHDNAGHRSELRAALVAQFLRTLSGDLLDSYRPVKPSTLRFSEKQCTTIIKKGQRTIRMRSAMAIMYYMILMDRMLRCPGILLITDSRGTQHKLDTSMILDRGPRLSITNILKNGSDPKNNRQRYWVPCKPVLHLALALNNALVCEDFPGKLDGYWLPKYPTDLSWEKLMSAKWLPRAVTHSETYRNFISSNPFFVAVKESETVRLLPATPSTPTRSS